ncbi:MAG: phage terminase small subunit [Plesiomonas shigelloides]
MMTPMQRQMRRQQEAQKADKLTISSPDAADSPQSQHIKLIALDKDIRHLRSLERISDRIAMKRDVLLPRWLPHAEHYLKGDRVYQNPILVYCIIWLLDTYQFERALQWADIAIEQGQSTPENFKSGLPTVIASNVFQWAELESEHGRSVQPYFSQVFERVAHRWKVHERLTAGYYKFAALLLLRGAGSEQPSGVNCEETLLKADALLEKAESLHPKIQVKTLRRRIDMRLRALAS